MSNWTRSQQALLDVWQQHLFAEFARKDVDMALATMTAEPSVLAVPVGRGGYGQAGVRRFYGQEFFAGMAADTQITPVAMTIAADTLIDESVVSFTHDLAMDWLVPGVAPTGRALKFAMIAVIGFEGGKIASERLYWDQATLLVQLGLIDPATPSVRGADVVELLLDPSKLT